MDHGFITKWRFDGGVVTHVQGVGGDVSPTASGKADTGDRTALRVPHGYIEVEDLAFVT